MSKLSQQRDAEAKPPKKEHYAKELLLAGFGALVEFLAIKFGINYLAWGAALLFWLAVCSFTKHRIGERPRVRYGGNALAALLLAMATLFLVTRKDTNVNAHAEEAPIQNSAHHVATSQASPTPVVEIKQQSDNAATIKPAKRKRTASPLVPQKKDPAAFVLRDGSTLVMDSLDHTTDSNGAVFDIDGGSKATIGHIKVHKVPKPKQQPPKP